MTKGQMEFVAEKIANRLMFLSGINQMGTELIPCLRSNDKPLDDGIRGGGWMRSDVIDAIMTELRSAETVEKFLNKSSVEYRVVQLEERLANLEERHHDLSKKVVVYES